MKTFLTTIIILFSTFMFAQDTKTYPLQIGNYWEYSTLPPEVLQKISFFTNSDTTMDNGKRYFHLEAYDFTYHSKGEMGYFREDSGRVYKYFGGTDCNPEFEYVYYDFNKADKEIWPICEQFYFGQGYRGADTTYIHYNEIFKKTLNERRYSYVRVMDSKIIWSPIGTPWPELVAAGIGTTYLFIEYQGQFYLTGAILNGVRYGTITNANDSKTPELNYSLSDNYPNPFNPSTEITYSLGKSGFVNLKIYDVLGREITTLVNEYKNTGVYKVTFNAHDIPSGIYFYSLEVNDYSVVKKMVFLK